MPRRRSSRQQLLEVKRIEKEKEMRRQSIEELILAEELRLQEKKKKSDVMTRQGMCLNMRLLELELQQLIIKLNARRQIELMRQAKLEREKVHLLGNGNKKSTGDIGALVVPESENAEPPRFQCLQNCGGFPRLLYCLIFGGGCNGWFYRPVRRDKQL